VEDRSGTEKVFEIGGEDQPDHPRQKQEQGNPGGQGL
jgi:hypothetical protein